MGDYCCGSIDYGARSTSLTTERDKDGVGEGWVFEGGGGRRARNWQGGKQKRLLAAQDTRKNEHETRHQLVG